MPIKKKYKEVHKIKSQVFPSRPEILHLNLTPQGK